MNLFGKTRDVFLVVKEVGDEPAWVEQNDFGVMPNYDKWSCLRRATIPADQPLKEFAVVRGITA